MNIRGFRRRGLARAAVLSGVIVAVAMTLAPAALESSASDGLRAYVVASTPGPLARGDTVYDFIYVTNGNDIISTTDGQFDARDTLHNAYVVSSVEEHIFVDGTEYASDTFYPPPNPYPRTWSDKWPSTVKCNSTCDDIRSPAVVPGERAAVLFAGWGHGTGEPSGRYVFRYTVHGTLNGTPVDVQASSVPITMTD